MQSAVTCDFCMTGVVPLPGVSSHSLYVAQMDGTNVSFLAAVNPRSCDSSWSRLLMALMLQ